jgi:anaerobic magnesium-protoporphyrin IX monomethyl ester cyclase
MGFETILSIPPDYDHNYPPLGTPALSAFLKKNGMACGQIDLNLGYRDFLAGRIFSPHQLNMEERRFFLKPLIRKFFAENLNKRYYSEFLPRDDADLKYLPYDNNTNSSFYFSERLLSSEKLWRYLEDSQENTFYQFYEQSGIIDILDNKGIGLFGISVISPSQAVAALTLGLFVKKALPHVHVNIGGQWATLYRDAILQKKELFRCFDSIIVFEGESALLELARRLESKRDISTIRNLITQPMTCDLSPVSCELKHDLSADSCELKHDLSPVSCDLRTPIFSGEDMDSHPCPDFDDLPLGDYNGYNDGRISLTYETSRGCYWSKCAYCVDLPLPKPSYRRKDPRLVIRDMKELKARYNAGYLFFGDPGLSPRQMREISERMIAENVKMDWWTMARLDPGFDRKLFDLAHKAGLRQVNFGFESANDRVSRFLDKGNQKDRSARIIKDCAMAGISVDLQTMVGLPGESFQDALDTIDFLVSNKEFISHATFNTYYLTPFNFIHRYPEKYGIEYEKDPGLPFRFFIPFRNKLGMDRDEAELLQNMYHSLVNKEEKIKKMPVSHDGGYVEFRLNGESSRLGYERNTASEVYAFK